MAFQLCYASRSTASGDRILNDLREIIGESRDFNMHHHIHGVLYFADKYFFHCIEGSEKGIQLLIGKLLKDPRHCDVKVLYCGDVEQTHFSDWSMKYVSRQSPIQHYFQAHGYNRFSPLELTDREIPSFLNLLYQADQYKISQQMV